MIRPVKRVYDEVHGYIDLSEVELRVVDTPYFQRLRFIKQLAIAWYVYPGATHTRFSHSLGVMHIMGLAAQRLYDEGYIHSADDVQLLRIAALLHDIGHTPFSHAIEPHFRERLGLGHEEMSRLIICESEIKDVLGAYGYDYRTVIALLEGRHREPVYNQLLSSDMDVDRMDYLIRDALHTGVTYGTIDLQRIVTTLTIDGEGNLAVLDKGIDALENFYLARTHMYRAVYYHKTIVGYEILLRRIYEMLGGYVDDPLLIHDEREFVEAVRSGRVAFWHDDWLIGLILRAVRERVCPELRELAESFFFRQGFKVLVDRTRFEDTPLDIERDGDVEYLKQLAEKIREAVDRNSVALFIDDIKIMEEDPHLVPRVILEGRTSLPVTYAENSMIRRLPKHLHIKRLYVMSKDVHKALRVLSLGSLGH